jgi:hypothetical protein
MRLKSCLLASLLLAAPAAQATQASFLHPGDLVPQAQASGAFGACVVRQAPRMSRELLATAPGSREEARLAASLAQGRAECLRGLSLGFSTGAFRGAVAEAMLHTTPGALAALAGRGSAPPVRPASADGRAFVIAYATCIAEAEPALAVALLGTERTSAAERAATIAFGTVLSACMPEDLEYRLDIADLRNHIAAHLYTLHGG